MKTSEKKSARTPAQDLRGLMEWIRGTDLSEVSYRRGETALKIGLESAAAPEAVFPPCSLIPISCVEVGIFRSSGKGKPYHVDKGSVVKKGAVVGIIDTGSAKLKVTAPESGKVVSVLIEDGQAVEYGQPLFFIQQ